MRKFLSKLAVMLLAPAALASSPALANGYLGVGVAAADHSGSNLETSVGGRVYGGILFLPEWGVELGYIDFGEFDAESSGGSVETNGAYLALSGFSRVGNNIELIGKLGIFLYDQDVNTAGGLTGSADGESALLGIGVQRYLSPSVAIGIEVNHFNDVEGEDINAVFLQLHANLDALY